MVTLFFSLLQRNARHLKLRRRHVVKQSEQGYPLEWIHKSLHMLVLQQSYTIGSGDGGDDGERWCRQMLMINIYALIVWKHSF